MGDTGCVGGEIGRYTFSDMGNPVCGSTSEARAFVVSVQERHKSQWHDFGVSVRRPSPNAAPSLLSPDALAAYLHHSLLQAFPSPPQHHAISRYHSLRDWNAEGFRYSHSLVSHVIVQCPGIDDVLSLSSYEFSGNKDGTPGMQLQTAQ